MAALTPRAQAFSGLVLQIFRLNGLLLAAGDELGASVGLTSARWQVLGVVDHAPAPVADIARTMGLARQSVQQTVNALVAEGFAEIRENPLHRRAHLVAITPPGRRALRAIERRHAAWAERLGARVGAAKLEAAASALTVAQAALEEEAG